MASTFAIQSENERKHIRKADILVERALSDIHGAYIKTERYIHKVRILEGRDVAYAVQKMIIAKLRVRMDEVYKPATKMFCAICLDESSDGKGFAVTACSHVFHTACIATWLLIKYTCPMCRRPVRRT